MKYLIILALFLSCSIHQQNSNEDEFEKIMYIMKTRQINDVMNLFGKPDEIKKMDDIKEFHFDSTSTHSNITVFLDLKENLIQRIAVFFWKDFDNYVYLKKRFEPYSWIEEKIQDKKSDAITDLYFVKIPEIGMHFEYDNNSPQRKIMWIFFDPVKIN